MGPRRRSPRPSEKPAEGLLSRWGRAVKRRSSSVDPRGTLKAARESLNAAAANVAEKVFGNANAPERSPGEVVKVAPRVYAVVGGGPADLRVVAGSARAAVLEMKDEEASTFADYGHADALDGDPLLRALLINVGDAPCADAAAFAGGCRVLDAGWEAPRHAPGPALAHAARLGLAAAAWLALDDSGRTLVVVGDLAAGDRARCGLAVSAILRVASAVLGQAAAAPGQQLPQLRIDAAAEGFGAYVCRAGYSSDDDSRRRCGCVSDESRRRRGRATWRVRGTSRRRRRGVSRPARRYLRAVGGDAERALSLERLPPSFGRGLKHLDFSVEARCLPNPRPLALLGASVRGLPLSDAPVLDVCSVGGASWSSEAPSAPPAEWDGDEAFYALGGDGCVSRAARYLRRAPISIERPRRGRGLAATRLRGMSVVAAAYLRRLDRTSRPRSRRDSSPRDVHRSRRDSSPRN